MKKVRNNSGFTLAELMVVVAIVAVLAGLGTVSIGAARRALHHREMDSYAKEIFVAAQNHLSMAKSEGALADLTGDARGTASGLTDDAGKGIYYFAVGGTPETYPGGGTSARVLDLMLPFGAIDDNVRMGGSYIIRYQFVTARVLDVFYTEDAVLSRGDYAELMEDTYRSMETDGKNARKKYSNNGVEADVGWFGGALASTLPAGKLLVEPTIEVVNGAKLLVNVENPNTDAESGYELKLIITGLTSHNQCVVDVIPASGSAPAWVKKTSTDSSRFAVTLDDVTTADMHFDQVANAAYTNAADAAKRLIPGEDITVQAVADYTGRLGNVARSSGVTTNSLFAAGNRSVSLPMTLPASHYTQQEAAVISNFRHLENLSYDISHFAPEGSAVYAVQNADLDWAEFRSDINRLNGKSGAALEDNVTVNAIPAASVVSAGFYRPVTLAGKNGATPALCYYGMDRDVLSSEPRIIRGLGDSTDMVNHITNGAPAGVFGVLYSGSTLMDVAALDFRISSAGPAGGLVGRMDGGTLAYCAAASIVRATGSSAPAGGLVGQTVSAQVTVYGCQTGGHTLSKTGGSISYYDSGTGKQNVVANTGSAGGLVGRADSTLHITGSYSTCSVSGSNAGGLVGSGTGGVSISGCYATGLVKGAHRGALAGSTGFSLTGNAYFSSINNGKDTTVLADHVKSGETDKDQDAKAKAFDTSLNDYRSLLSQIENTSCTFNNKLPEHYDFKTVGELTGSSRTGSNIHYGDWPIPDNLLVNTRIGG